MTSRAIEIRDPSYGHSSDYKHELVIVTYESQDGAWSNSQVISLTDEMLLKLERAVYERVTQTLDTTDRVRT